MRERINKKISHHYNNTKDKLIVRFPHLYYKLNNNKLIIKFLITASLTGVVDFLFLFLLYEILNENIIFSSSVAFSMAFFFNFKLNKVWTFRRDGPHSNQEFFSYLSLNILKLFANSFLMYYLVSEHDIWYIYAQFLVGIFLNFVTFFLTKIFVFKKDDLGYGHRN